MILLPPDIAARLAANFASGRAAREDEQSRHDPAPVLKLFSPLGAATWVATELYDDRDTLFGLADLGFGCPAPGVFSLSAIANVRLPFGLRIERDLTFASAHPLSVWGDTARRLGSIMRAEAELG
jgi:hypothetical protein